MSCGFIKEGPLDSYMVVMIRVIFLAINKDEVLLMRCVK